MPAPAEATPDDARTYRAIGALDGAALAWTLAFVAWLLAGDAGRPHATRTDLLFIAPLSLVTCALTVVAGRRASTARDRWAWYVLGSGFLLRAVTGAFWRWMAGAGVTVPAWASGTAVLRFALEVAGLMLFASARRRPADRVRLALDSATVLVGVALVEWYFPMSLTGAGLPSAQGPAGAHSLAAYVTLLNGSMGALLAALLTMRRADEPMRRAGFCLLVAFSMQATSDYLQWSGSLYRPGDATSAWWWAIWLLRLAAVRSALTTPGQEVGVPSDPRAEAPYRSGVVPYLFLGAANVTLWVELSAASPASSMWMVGAISVLTLLLVARQVVERREHTLLARAQSMEQARFAALVEHSYDAVILVLPSGGASYISPTTRRHLGDNPVYDEAWGLLAAVHPDDAPRVREVLTQRENASAQLTCRVRSADGEWRSFALRIVDLRADQRVGAIAIHGHDVTRELQLARRLHETAEVEALGVFASGLAHDLNNVLGAISSHVELLLMDVPAGSDAHEELRAIQRAVARGVRLTRALLGLSRRKAPAMEQVDVRELLAARGSLEEGGEGLQVRLDRVSVGHALDAVLSEDAAGGMWAGPWRTTVSRCLLQGRDAAMADLDEGSYARVDCEAAASRQGIDASLRGDPSASDDEGLDVLLARAVLREMGGTLVVHPAREGTRRLTFFLPAEIA